MITRGFFTHLHVLGAMLYFTADTHFAREGRNLLGRDFTDVREMSETILEAINSRAGKYDRLVIVGDFSFREPEYWRGRLRCKNAVLVLGNHDRPARSRRAFGEMNVRETYDTKCCGHPCWASHYPTCFWPKSHYGSFHVFGHVHDMRTETLSTIWPQMRAMDVGVDAARRVLGSYTCFSEQEIYDLLIQRAGHDPVDWYLARRKNRYGLDLGEQAIST